MSCAKVRSGAHQAIADVPAAGLLRDVPGCNTGVGDRSVQASIGAGDDGDASHRCVARLRYAGSRLRAAKGDVMLRAAIFASVLLCAALAFAQYRAWPAGVCMTLPNKVLAQAEDIVPDSIWRLPETLSRISMMPDVRMVMLRRAGASACSFIRRVLPLMTVSGRWRNQ